MEIQRQVRVAWSTAGADFNDMLCQGLDRCIVELYDQARPLPPFLVADSIAAEPSRRRRRAKSAAGAEAPGSGGEHVQSVPATAVPSSESNGAGGKPPTPGDDGGEGPRSHGFSVDGLNKEFAVVMYGGDTIVLREQPDARRSEDQVRMLGLDGFKTWLRNRFTEVRAHDGKIKRLTWANAWLDAPNRRQYQGIEFFPDPQNVPGTPGYFNLWSGFAVPPAPVPDSTRYKTFRDHLLVNVCRGDDKLFRWLFAFFAHIVQRPRERLGIALVLRGGQGFGKTKVGEIIGSLFPRHWFLADTSRYVTGQFNSYMAGCLILQADEAVWAGDKAAEGRLKGLITSSIQFIEVKGVDAVRFDNYVRLIMTSNDDWVVPAGKDERRFAVFDVDPRCAQNQQYFAEMTAEIAAGGLAHLLADLLAFDLNSVDLRNAPRTDALLEQKIRSLNSVESWWYGRLCEGTTTRRDAKWLELVPISVLFDDYVAAAEKIGVRRKRRRPSLASLSVSLCRDCGA